ncbi:hypothetical protein [Mesorhizobium sangaii]|uniref:Uncharacterized protein n=1 Tax=Mesorhizobium sangaii TaxID=505389 RepID=A0A841PES4_9HYPH|nr:hypothetical protein [Mesorhizobium sangaii]MBB6413707.1 hypothetical protein [Mesorhizobium sangaii]
MSEILGTAFLVHGTWYLRYLHGGGTMVPIEASADLKDMLNDGYMVVSAVSGPPFGSGRDL